MATKFVFNPFSGTFDIISPSSWDDLVCGLPDYVVSRPIVLAGDGSLFTAPIVLTIAGSCKVEDLAGNTIYSGTPYSP
jgi:hypothetical protein